MSIAALSGLKLIVQASHNALKMGVEQLVLYTGATNRKVRQRAERPMRRAFEKTENKGDVICSRKWYLQVWVLITQKSFPVH